MSVGAVVTCSSRIVTDATTPHSASEGTERVSGPPPTLARAPWRQQSDTRVTTPLLRTTRHFVGDQRRPVGASVRGRAVRGHFAVPVAGVPALLPPGPPAPIPPPAPAAPPLAGSALPPAAPPGAARCPWSLGKNM